MKVLQINTVYGTGSTGRIIRDLSKALKDHNDECYFAYRHIGKSFENGFQIGVKLENHLHNLGSRLFDKQGYFTTSGTKKLVQQIEKIKPHIIHLHNIHGNYLNISILFEFLSKVDIPVIWTLHDCWSFTGHCAYFDYSNCEKWRTHCNYCPNIHSYPTSYFIDSSKSNFDKKKSLFNQVKNMTIVTPSNWLAGLVKQSFLSKFNIQVINNGINTQNFNIRDTEYLKKKLQIKGKIILLGVSAEGFEGRKGLKYFIKLANELPPSYKLILVGVTCADKRKLPNNVITIARTESMEQLADYYSLADIFVNPTLEDNFPTTNLESLACGTPVITFQTGGSPESLDKETGIVVPKMDFILLLNGILSMNSQFKENNTFSCRNKAVANFDKTKMYQQYLQLYHENSLKK